jgi:glutamate synthase (NADPH/NADH) small chain
MGDPRGFLKLKRKGSEYRPVCDRVKDYEPVATLRPERVNKEQASRCMDCGTPFCLWGCPVSNIIPEWNDLVYNGQWQRAFELLDSTNVLPEVTGRVCPAPCEYACVLGINDDPVTIRENELAIIEYAFKNGLVKPHPPKVRTGKKVAVVGSGPAGLSCAVHLNRSGHSVVVFECADKIGGIMRYGIPDFKMEKNILDRRIEVWKKEGIEFRTGINVKPEDRILFDFDAVCRAGGARDPRDLKIEGRALAGIHFAMDYLTRRIDAKGKKVVVIGGGDTGADCMGTAHRQGAACVVQIEILPRPSEKRSAEFPWPKYPVLFKTTSSHEEGGERHWSVATKKFIGDNSIVKKLLCERAGVPGSEFEIEADLVILALGFIRHEIKPEKGVFFAGDMRTGPSLIVKAINDGRQAAEEIISYLGS